MNESPTTSTTSTADSKPLDVREWWSESPSPIRPRKSPAPTPGLIALTRSEEGSPPVGWRELVAITLLVSISDILMYRGGGFAGYALLFVVAALCLAVGKSNRRGSFWT